MKQIVYLFIVSLFLLSCKDNRNSVQTVILPEIVELSSTAKSIDTDLLMPTNLLISGNKLIVHERTSKDMIKIFDFPSLKYLYSFGIIGQGPGDFLSNNLEIIDITSDLMEVHDSDKIKIIHFSDSSATIESILPLPQLHLKNAINRLRKLNDSIYYFDNMFDGDKEHEFTRQNIHSGERTYFSPYPKWVKNQKTQSEYDKYTIYLKMSRVNKSKKKIFSFYLNFPVMRILDFDGNIMNEIHIKTREQNFSGSYKDYINYFTSQYSLTADYIYAWWIEKTQNEIMAESNNFRPEILVFDWEGAVVGRYKLDRPITAFTISKETGKLYGVSAFDDADINSIYEYELPHVK